MKAVERNVSGSTRRLTAPISVSSLRASRAMAIDRPPIAQASRIELPIMVATPATPPGRLAPTARPSATMIRDWMSTTTASWPKGPAISDDRRAGETRKRSSTPRSRSLMIPIPLQPAVKSAVMTTMPGTRKST